MNSTANSGSVFRWARGSCAKVMKVSISGLPEFYAAHPEMTVNVQAPATDLPHLSPGICIAIRYGTGGWREGTTLKLFDERVWPVAAPALPERLQAEGVGLDRAPLIHVRSPHNQHWAGWVDYLRAGASHGRVSRGRSSTTTCRRRRCSTGAGRCRAGAPSRAARCATGRCGCGRTGELDLGTS